MKKISLAVLTITTLALGSCTMPWTKTTSTPEEIVPVEETPAEIGTKTNDTPAPLETPKTEEQVQKDTTPTDTPKAIAEGGVYLPYTATAVAQAKGNVVLFFHASWCPTCVAINKDIEAHIKDIPKDLTLLKVNYDEAGELRTLYSVTNQHTFVQVDNSGKLIKKWRGGSTLGEVLGQVEGGSKVEATANVKASF